MKALNILLCLALTVCASRAATQPVTVPDGWTIRSANNDYQVSVDSANFSQGKHSACLKATTSSPQKFVDLMQSFRADDYRGKRLRLSAQVKVQGTRPETQLWMRIDTASKRSVAFDNMADRVIRSPSDWKKWEIVLDVPPDSLNISFGVLLAGNGQVWVDDFQFEVVGALVPVTKGLNPRPSAKQSEPAKQIKPVNLDFER